jgi:hypothetical protein
LTLLQAEPGARKYPACSAISQAAQIILSKGVFSMIVHRHRSDDPSPPIRHPKLQGCRQQGEDLAWRITALHLLIIQAAVRMMPSSVAIDVTGSK